MTATTGVQVFISYSHLDKKLNDVKNALYQACLSSPEVESDRVLIVLQGLPVVGPA